MFTVLSTDGRKILVGNRKGKVFATNASWLKRRPHIWKMPVYVTVNPVLIPVVKHLSNIIEDSVSVSSKFSYDIYELKQRGYINRTHKPYSKLSAWCAFNRYEWIWYVYQRS